MFNLDPGKLIVIAVVAIILLGPDRLPQVARQVGGAWRSFNEFRHRMESEVRTSMPDLPPTSEIARLARSPSALLNHLSNMSSDDADQDEAPDGSFQPPVLPDAVAGNGQAPAPRRPTPPRTSRAPRRHHRPRPPWTGPHGRRQPAEVIVPSDPTLN